MSECTHNCSTCGENCSSRNALQSFLEPVNSLSTVGKVYAVVSGKGGVGKSTVTSLLSVMTATKGFKTAVLDADITGPSIPKMLGISDRALADDNGIYPGISKSGVRAMSLNMLVEDETTPVIWRGPVIAGTVKHFWTDVVWGELDYLFVDMPPGTGDVPLTVFQSLPVDGVVVVTSPQELVQMIVKKAYNMAQMMKVPVLGIVENFSYLECPDCGKKISVFGESHVDQVAGELGIPVFAKLPIDPSKAAAADAGEFYGTDHSAFETAIAALK